MLHQVYCSKSSMGAAATVETRSSISSTQSKNSTMPICCEACKIQLGIFKRKKCVVCLKIHCSRCLSSRATHFDSRSACIKCHSLVAGDYTRDYLMSCFTTGELRDFLLRHHVATEDRMEKKDIIDLMMQRRRPSTSRHVIGEEVPHISPLRDFSHEHQSEASRTNRSASTPSFSGTNSNSHQRIRTENRGDSVSQMSSSGPRLPNSASDEPITASLNLPSDNSPNILDATNMSSSGPRNSDSDRARRHTVANDSAISQTYSGQPVRHRIMLADINSHQDIQSLNIRQLKDILINNYVDYKGCCERQELVDRVILLWTDHEKMKTNVNASGGDDSGKDSDLCKICMDSAIDCILLECGHMVACTLCGKRLAECPICRQYVSRVVHVFRA